MKASSNLRSLCLGIWKAAGMTLVEILIVISLLGIALTVALPSYRQYVLRGHRTEAIRIVHATAACLERNHASNGSYDTELCARPPNMADTGSISSRNRILLPVHFPLPPCRWTLKATTLAAACCWITPARARSRGRRKMR